MNREKRLNLMDITNDEGTAMVEVKNITKQYRGKCVLDHITFSLANQTVGLLGPNGAGKTTLMRILVGIEKQSGGEILYKDKNRETHPLRRLRIGYLPQSFGLIKNYTLYEHMQYFSCLKGIDKKQWEKEINKVLELVHLEHESKTKCRKLSGGMVRRAGIAQALLGNPGLLLLDEPTVGLDPEERMRFHDIVKTLEGSCPVMISTHIIEDVNKTCNDVIVMKEGEILYHGNPGRLRLQDMEGYLYLLKNGHIAGETDEE